jgi:hypothetical protein
MSLEAVDPHEVDADCAAASNRRYERALSARPIPRRSYCVDDFRPLDAWIVDVSRSGLALYLPDPLPEETVLFLELETLPQAPPVKVWATVVHFQPGENGDWLHGCELVNPLSTKQLRSLLV